MPLETIYTSPSPEDFVRLRLTANWGDVSLEDARTALRHSLFCINLYNAGELIGMARCIGDGVFNVYIQDVVVKPSWRGKGLGRDMIRSLILHMKPKLPSGCTIGLMAAIGQDGFYAQLGFTQRPNKNFGAGFTAQLKDLTL